MSKIPSAAKTLKKLKKDDSESETDKIEDDEIIESDEDDDEDKDENDIDVDLEDDNELDVDINDDEYNKVCNIQKVIDDDEYYDDDEELEIKPDSNIEYVKKEERQSLAKLTKFEKVRILGERTTQLTMGAKPLIKNYKGLDYEKIAEEELKLNMIPFKIRRPLPNGKYELWNLDELSKTHLLYLIE